MLGVILKKATRLYPGRMLCMSLLGTIFIGTLLLMLPFARTQPVPFGDLFFTATSVTCVCGLLTVPLSAFTVFGKMVILLLMQIGGLGVITLTLILMSLIVDMGLSTQTMAGQFLDIDSLDDIKRILWFMVILVFGTELVGAIALFWVGPPTIIENHAFLSALFYSVSSFCNVGLSLDPANLTRYQMHGGVLGIIGIIMTISAIGFVTWYELLRALGAWIQRKRHRRISLHSRIAVMMGLSIVIIATLLFWALERHHAFGHLDAPATWGNALFNAIGLRSTGFYTMAICSMQTATFFLIMALSFIGSSPGSTGGGIKVAVFAVFLATLRTIFVGRTTVVMWGRSIPRLQVYKALSIITLSIFWVGIVTFMLLIVEPRQSFLAILFEAISSFTNLGVSLGITPHLSGIGKIWVCMSMIAGRIGSLSLVLSISQARRVKEVTYPEERIMLN